MAIWSAASGNRLAELARVSSEVLATSVQDWADDVPPSPSCLQPVVVEVEGALPPMTQSRLLSLADRTFTTRLPGTPVTAEVFGFVPENLLT